MKINEVIDILKDFKPVSIFVYGSQANNSLNSKSDYEVGVIFENEKYLSRNELLKTLQIKNSPFSLLS